MALGWRCFGGGGNKLQAVVAVSAVSAAATRGRVVRESGKVIGSSAAVLVVQSVARRAFGAGRARAIGRCGLQQQRQVFCSSHGASMSEPKQAGSTTASAINSNSRSSNSSSGRATDQGTAATAASIHHAAAAATAAGDNVRRAWEHFSSLASPRFIMGSMQEGSDLPFRLLCKPHGVQLAFTPRLYAKHLVNEQLYKLQNLVTSPDDLPLVTMLCANEPGTFTNACRVVQEAYKGPVCLDLAWDTKRAHNGNYGMCLLKQRDLVRSMISQAAQDGHSVYAALRVSEATEDLEGLLRLLEESGSVGVVVDTRSKEEQPAFANWDLIARIKSAAGIPVLAHASLNSRAEVDKFLSHTGADGVVATTELLHEPDFFSSAFSREGSELNAVEVAEEYLKLFRANLTFPYFARWHLFHLLHTVLLHMPDIFDDLHNANTAAALETFVQEVKRRVQAMEPAFAAAVARCQIRPPLAHTLDIATAVTRFAGDDDQVTVARAWAEGHIKKETLPQDHAEQYRRLQYDPNGGNERKLNRLAKRKLKRLGFQKQQKEEKKARGKRRQQREHASTGEGDHESKKTKQEIKAERRERVKNAMTSPTAIRVAVDMGLNEHMNRKEIVKLSDQIRRLYGANLHAQVPCHVHLTGLSRGGLTYKLCKQRNIGFDDYLMTMTEQSHVEHFKQSELVFLTPDSPNVLVDLVPSKVYVLGGLVDEQIQKNLTLGRAQKAGIMTARLPIPEFSNASATKYAPVLSINQVFDAFLKLQCGEGWRAALSVAVPERKGFALYSEDAIADKVADMQQQCRDGVFVPSGERGETSKQEEHSGSPAAGGKEAEG